MVLLRKITAVGVQSWKQNVYGVGVFFVSVACGCYVMKNIYRVSAENRSR